MESVKSISGVTNPTAGYLRPALSCAFECSFGWPVVPMTPLVPGIGRKELVLEIHFFFLDPGTWLHVEVKITLDVLH